MIARVIETLVGLWLMAAPAILSYGPPGATSDRIVGPVIASFSVIAMWEATRNVRWANVPCAIWLIVAPLVLSYDAGIATLNSVLCGILLGVLLLVKGSIKKEYGGGWRSLFSAEPPHDAAGSTRE